MADEATNSNPRPFDVRTIKYLVSLMSRHDLSEIDLREGDLRIRLLRGPRGKVVTTVASPAPAAAPVAAPAAPVEASKPIRHLVEIKSEGPGTFYAKPNPEADSYVRVGARVTPETVVGLLEAMKLYTEIQAGCSGVIEEILVQNQEAVEYGQVLFRVNPTG